MFAQPRVFYCHQSELLNQGGKGGRIWNKLADFGMKSSDVELILIFLNSWKSAMNCGLTQKKTPPYLKLLLFQIFIL